MTESEFQKEAQEFVKGLKHYPQVGKRPFGYPKSAWWMSGAWGFFGVLLQIPIIYSEGLQRGPVLASLFGVLLFCLGFTMRVVAFTSSANGVMDRWLSERIQRLERHLKDTDVIQ